MIKDFNDDVALPPISYDSSESPYMARYFKDKKEVSITGAGYPEQGLLTAYGFKNLSSRQANAMELGLRIFSYLETGEYPSFEATRLENQPGVQLNMKVEND